MADHFWPNEEEKVTVIRYRVIFEEAVISREEYERTNRSVSGEHLGSVDENLDFLDWGWGMDEAFQHVVKKPEGYVAFEGDVTSGSDDLVSLTSHHEWSHSCFEPIPLVSNRYMNRLRLEAETHETQH